MGRLGVVTAGLVLAYAVIGKVMDPNITAATLEDVTGVSHGVAGGMTIGLIALETALVAGLVLTSTRRFAAGSCVMFLLVVSVGPVVQLATGSEVGCGCGFGSALPPAVEQVLSIIRNVLLAGLLLPAFLRP